MADPRLSEWNERLQVCSRDLANKRKWSSSLDRVREELDKQKRLEQSCLAMLTREEQDVERLNHSTLAQFWYGLLGKLEEKLQTEEREIVEAKLKYDAARAQVRLLESQQAELIGQLAEVADADSRLERLKAEKEAWIREHDAGTAAALASLSERIGAAQAKLIEIREAEQAGKAARESLRQAEDRLESAANWGTYDMLGGGMISTAIKHGRIDEARDHIHEAQHRLRRFADELRDVHMRSDAGAPEIGGFLGFADYFFDGLISDWMVQGKIRDSLDSVRSSARQADQALRELDRRRADTERQAEADRTDYEQAILQYGR